jgi:hypothetical protein
LQNHLKNQSFRLGLFVVAGVAEESADICATLSCAEFVLENLLIVENCLVLKKPAGKFADFHRFFWGFPQIYIRENPLKIRENQSGK